MGPLPRPLPRLMLGPVPPGDRTRGTLADTMGILERINAREAERNAAERRTREAAAAQAQEERRQREAREARLKTGTALLDKSLEGASGLGPWDRYVIRAAGVAALAGSSTSEPIDAVVDEILRVQLRLHAPAPPPPAVVAQPAPPVAPAEVNDPDDDEEDFDPDCPRCVSGEDHDEEEAQPVATAPGWGGLLALGLGAAALIMVRSLKAPAVPPQP